MTPPKRRLITKRELKRIGPPLVSGIQKELLDSITPSTNSVPFTKRGIDKIPKGSVGEKVYLRNRVKIEAEKKRRKKQAPVMNLTGIELTFICDARSLAVINHVKLEWKVSSAEAIRRLIHANPIAKFYEGIPIYRKRKANEPKNRVRRKPTVTDLPPRINVNPSAKPIPKPKASKVGNKSKTKGGRHVGGETDIDRLDSEHPFLSRRPANAAQRILNSALRSGGTELDS